MAEITLEGSGQGLAGRRRSSGPDPMKAHRLSAREEREIAPFRRPSGAVIRDDFANLIEFRKWAKDYWRDHITQTQKEYFYLTDEQVRSQATWGSQYGKGASANEILEGIRRFRDPDLIGSLLARFETALPQEIRNAVPKRRLDYNDRGLGVFSFDRAAQGLYRLPEFVNLATGQKVDDRLVEREAASPNSTGKERYWQAATQPRQELVKRWELRPDGSPLFRTTSKRVFGHFPKTKRMKAATEIFVSCGNYSDITPEQFLYSGMVALVIARLLIRGGVPVKINTVIGWRGSSSTEDYCCAVVPLKHYDEPLDDNLLAVATSDPRFWRCEGFRACMCLRRSAGMNLSGAGLVGYDLRRVFNQAPYAKGTANRFFFGRVRSQAEALTAIEDAIVRILEALNS